MEEKTVDFQVVDAFTVGPFGGNPAGIVLEAGELSEKQMQTIANEIGLSETAFVVGRDGDAFEVRYFTPTAEIAFCGHASIAVTATLAKTGHIEVKDEPVKASLKLKAGDYPVEVRPHPVTGVEVVLQTPKPKFRPFGYSLDLLCGILGIDRYQLPEHWPLRMASAGTPTLVVPVTTKDSLDAARPDFESLSQFHVKIGVEVTMLYTWQGPIDLYCRGFAPSVGVPEDPVTGSGIAAVAAVVVKERAVQLSPPESKLTAEQGTRMGRPGHVPIEVRHDDSGVEWVRIAGTTVPTIEGKIRLPK